MAWFKTLANIYLSDSTNCICPNQYDISMFMGINAYPQNTCKILAVSVDVLKLSAVLAVLVKILANTDE